MLNEERIKLMSQMACYEENEGRKNMAVGSYFRGDYIALQVIKSLINATIAFAILFALFIMYDFEVFMTDFYKMDLFAFGKSVITAYLVFVAVYGAVSYGVYTYRYIRARKSLKVYYNNLKKLAYLYDKENKR